MSGRGVVFLAIIFVGLPLFSASLFALNYVASKKGLPHRRIFRELAWWVGVPSLLISVFYAIILLGLILGGGLRYAVPAG